MPTVCGRRVIERAIEMLGPTWRGRCTVIDNASADGTRDLLERRFPEVRRLPLARNIGFGAAVNAGAALSDAEALVVMNDDVLCPPTSLESLVAALDDPAMGMASGVLVSPASGRVDTAGIACDPALASHDLLQGESPDGCLGRVLSEPVGPTGGLAVYRRRSFQDAGGFDPGFFLYYEDVDLALRLRRAGWRSTIVLTARAEHVGSATLGWRSSRKAALVGRSRGRIIAKYGVLKRPRALPWILAEVLAAILLCLELRSTEPVAARWRGYRECRCREPYPKDELIGCRSLLASVHSRFARRYRHGAGK